MVHVDIVVCAALSVAEGHAVALAVLVILGPLSRRQDLAVGATAGHGLGLGASVVDHGWELAAAGVDEPVGDLVYVRVSMG